ncbi:MAG: hypothetical protein LBH74_00750 [Nitrososphaerota archaeon]|jgi:type II secretory pathway pseudopilin PulG|nr:hypothetical protein [Nitrososphaerota archaeon]
MSKTTIGLATVCAILAILLAASVASNLIVQTDDGNRIEKLDDANHNLRNDNQELQYDNQKLQNNVDNLQSENRRLEDRVNGLQSENRNLQANVNSLQDKTQELQDIADLTKSKSVADKQTLSQQAGHSNVYTVSAQYAGYIYVHIDSSTTDKGVVQVSYTSNGGKSPHTIRYDQKSSGLALGSSVCFPVLPGTITVSVGNANAINGATQTVTIDYWY